MLFINSKYISISYVKSELSTASRFLELVPTKYIENKNSTEDFSFFKSRFDNTKKTDIKTVKNSWQNDPLSASKLNLYINCKRAFYYKYIEKIKEHRLSLEPEAYEVGSRYHDILFDIFQNKKFSTKDELKNLIKQNLIEKNDPILLRFELNIWLTKIDAFLDNEIERQNLGYKPIALEKSFNIEIDGVAINGQIDRVDIKDDKIHIIDYKLKKSIKIENKIELDKIKDYQLAIYYLASKELFNKEIDSVGFYDVAHGKIVHDDFVEQKAMLLPEMIHKYKNDDIELSVCNNIYCNYCRF
jgi:ATP-dependent exoDNAse (exonuclease V) beta subunit